MDFNKLALEYKDQALDFLFNILRINTVLTEYNPDSQAPFGNGNKKCLEAFLNKASLDGFKTLNCDNYAGHIEYGNGEDIVGVLGHLDVVPVTGEWITPPFDPSIRDNKIFARGVLDDKGPMVAAYFALKMLKDNDISLNKRVRIILGCDEETGSRCLKYYFTKEEKPSLGFSPDANYPLIYGEKCHANFFIKGKLSDDSIIKSWNSGTVLNVCPSRCEVTLKGNYSNEFNIFIKKNNYHGEIINNTYVIYGKEAHGSLPEQGLNANYPMVDFINTIHKDNFTMYMDKYMNYDDDGANLGIDVINGDMGHLSKNTGKIIIDNGNIYIGVDIRVPTKSHDDIIRERLKNTTNEYGLSYEFDGCGLYHYVDPNSFLVDTLYSVYKAQTNDNINKPMTIGGGTYAKLLDNCVAFGPVFPNEEEAIHCPNEYWSIDSFIKNIAIYAESIYKLSR